MYFFRRAKNRPSLLEDISLSYVRAGPRAYYYRHRGARFPANGKRLKGRDRSAQFDNAERTLKRARSSCTAIRRGDCLRLKSEGGEGSRVALGGASYVAYLRDAEIHEHPLERESNLKMIELTTDLSA